LDDINDFCRYSDIRTYKDNRVNIHSKHNYINASWIHLPLDFYFIATQGPIESTVEDFWEMCYTYDIKIIVMICNLTENGREKCANYWEANLEKYKIVNHKERDLDVGLIKRTFEMQNLQEKKSKIIVQIQLTTWDDHAAPISNYSKIIKMIQFIDKYRNINPVLVHCSAGVGRTGSFISMYNLYYEIMEQIQNPYISEIKCSVMNTVRKLKEMRLYLVENEKQYLLLYEFVDKLLCENNKNYLLLSYFILYYYLFKNTLNYIFILDYLNDIYFMKYILYK
jgi:protein tyrosine phosphatase